MHFAGGPNAFASDVGFVRFPAGLQFPHHRHLGREVNYVLQGVLRDGDGTLYYPGDALIKGVEDTHSSRSSKARMRCSQSRRTASS
jgi:putative transcriptional regulator